MFFELAHDTAKLAHERGIKNVFVSNGYMTPQAVEKIAPFLDAINVDLKAFRDETYRRLMKAHLEPVLVCLRELARRRIWLEVTTLVVPGMNDSEKELREIAGFIAGELGESVPWHVSRFHGDYKMSSVPTTPAATLELACRAGKEAGLKFVYCGNAPGEFDESTRCPKCGEMLIDRVGFTVRRNNLSDGRCGSCGEEVEGVWN